MTHYCFFKVERIEGLQSTTSKVQAADLGLIPGIVCVTLSFTSDSWEKKKLKKNLSTIKCGPNCPSQYNKIKKRHCMGL